MTFLASFDGLLWFAAMLAALNFLQLTLHREIQSVFLLLSRSVNITILLFSLLFIPGVFLHELSHFLTAKVLRVRTGNFSLLPEPMPDGKLRMGYVETVPTDILRDSLIGLAPIVFGSLFVAWVAVDRLHLLVMWDTLRGGQWNLFWLGTQTLFQTPDFWLWFYLAFTVSSSMMPSAADRNSWGMLGLALAAALVLFLLAGAGPWLLQHAAPPLNAFLRGAALVLFFANLAHLALWPVFAAFHRLLTRLTGLEVKP